MTAPNMNARDWLQHVGMLIEAKMPQGRTYLMRFAGPLKTRADARHFTVEAAEKVAEAIKVSGSLPDFDQLVRALHTVADTLQRPVSPGAQAPQTSGNDDERWKGHWLSYFYKRLGEGVQGPALANLVSLVRAQSKLAYAVIAPEYDRERWEAETFRADDLMARRADAAADALARSSRFPAGPRKAVEQQVQEPDRIAVRPSLVDRERLNRMYAAAGVRAPQAPVSESGA